MARTPLNRGASQTTIGQCFMTTRVWNTVISSKTFHCMWYKLKHDLCVRAFQANKVHFICMFMMYEACTLSASSLSPTLIIETMMALWPLFYTSTFVRTSQVPDWRTASPSIQSITSLISFLYVIFMAIKFLWLIPRFPHLHHA